MCSFSNNPPLLPKVITADPTPCPRFDIIVFKDKDSDSTKDFEWDLTDWWKDNDKDSDKDNDKVDVDASYTTPPSTHFDNSWCGFKEEYKLKIIEARERAAKKIQWNKVYKENEYCFY